MSNLLYVVVYDENHVLCELSSHRGLPIVTRQQMFSSMDLDRKNKCISAHA